MSEKSEHSETRLSVGPKALLRALSFKKDMKSRLMPRKKSLAPATVIDKKSKPLKRTGSFNDNSHKLDIKENKSDAQKLEEASKQIFQVFKYVESVLESGKFEVIPPSVTVVLEKMMALDSFLSSYVTPDESSALTAKHYQVHHDLGELIRSSDEILVHKAQDVFDKGSISELVTRLKTEIDEFLTLAKERVKIRSCQTLPSPSSMMPKTAAIISDRSPMPLTSRERQNMYGPSQSNINSNLSYSADNILDERPYSKVPEYDEPPPKPPIPKDLVLLSLNLADRAMSNLQGMFLKPDDTEEPPPLPRKIENITSNVSPSFNNRPFRNGVPNEQDLSKISIMIDRLNLPLNHSHSNSINSVSSISSEDILDEPPPKPARTPTTSPAPVKGSRLSQYDNIAFPEAGSENGATGNETPDFGAHVSPLAACLQNNDALSDKMCRLQGSEYKTVVSNVVSHQFVASKSECSYNSEQVVLRHHVAVRQSESTVVKKSFASVEINPEHDYTDGALEAPPLPPKQKHVEEYMSVFGRTSYSTPQEMEVNLPRQSIDFYQYQRFERFLEESSFASYPAVQTFNASVAAGSMSNHSSGLYSETSSVSTSSEDSQSVPPLPPKQSHQLSLTEIETPPLPEDVKLSPGLLDLCLHKDDSQPDESPSTSEGRNSFQKGKDSAYCSEQSIQSVLDSIDVTDQLVFKPPEEDGQGPVVRGGSVDALIVYATSSGSNRIGYQEAFLTTYRTFISPKDLIDKLMYRYNNFSKLDDSRKKYAMQSFSLIVRVINDLCAETDEKPIKATMEIVHQLFSNGELKQAHMLRERVLEKCQNRQLMQQQKTNKSLFSSYQVTAKSHSLFDFKSESLAEQMTIWDSDLFHKINISELLLWSREQKEDHSPNLTEFTQHFNKMSYWCRTRILEKEDARERERCMMKFIKIMKHLRRLNNFNSYLAILSALDSSPVARLEWQKQNVEALKEFCQLIDSSCSFRAYRQACSEADPPCIPYIGLVLQDLTFIHIGNKDLDEEGRINFSKCWQLFTVLDPMRQLQRSTKYSIKRNEKIVSFFDNFDSYLTEDALWQISEEIKPRPKKKTSKQMEPS